MSKNVNFLNLLSLQGPKNIVSSDLNMWCPINVFMIYAFNTLHDTLKFNKNSSLLKYYIIPSHPILLMEPVLLARNPGRRKVTEHKVHGQKVCFEKSLSKSSKINNNILSIVSCTIYNIVNIHLKNIFNFLSIISLLYQNRSFSIFHPPSNTPPPIF